MAQATDRQARGNPGFFEEGARNEDAGRPPRPSWCVVAPSGASPKVVRWGSGSDHPGESEQDLAPSWPGRETTRLKCRLFSWTLAV